MDPENSLEMYFSLEESRWAKKGLSLKSIFTTEFPVNFVNPQRRLSISWIWLKVRLSSDRFGTRKRDSSTQVIWLSLTLRVSSVGQNPSLKLVSLFTFSFRILRQGKEKFWGISSMWLLLRRSSERSLFLIRDGLISWILLLPRLRTLKLSKFANPVV